MSEHERKPLVIKIPLTFLDWEMWPMMGKAFIITVGVLIAVQLTAAIYWLKLH